MYIAHSRNPIKHFFIYSVCFTLRVIDKNVKLITKLFLTYTFFGGGGRGVMTLQTIVTHNLDCVYKCLNF